MTKQTMHFVTRLRKFFCDVMGMQTDAAQYLKFVESDEIRQRNATRLIVAVLVAGGGGVAGALYLNLNSFVASGGFLVLFSMVMLVKRKQDGRALSQEEALLRLLEVDPELFENTGFRQRLTLAAETGRFDEVQVRKKTGSIRGHDEKGFTGGVEVDAHDGIAARRDVKESEGIYDGLEGELSPSEHLVVEANAQYEVAANERWKAAEEADVDLIEAGVERLGDLIRTDWLEKNAKDGALDKLMGQGQKE